jgi:hypothetical protein
MDAPITDAPITRRPAGRAPAGRPRRLAVATLIAALALGACGDDDADDPGRDELEPGVEQTTTFPGGGEMPPTTAPRGTTEELPERPQDDGAP